MRYRFPDPNLFVTNRQRLAAVLKPGALVILHSNDVPPTNADGTLPFHQNSDIFHLCGIDQEETILVLFPHAYNEKQREILFIRESNDHIKVWEGAKLTKEQARERSGMAHVHYLHEFPKLLRSLMVEAEHVYLNTNEHNRAADEVETRDLRFIRECQRQFPLHSYQRLAPLMARLRSMKQPEEIEILKEACRITGDAFHRVLRFVRPGIREYEVEAEIAHEFIRQGSRGHAYPPIIAAGGNNNVLHYVDNYEILQDGDLLLLDVGAEYANYNADLTRTIPINGKYTPRQRQVYEAVLRILRSATAILRPGILIADYTKEVGRFAEQELIGLGLLDADAVAKQNPEEPLFRKYLMHGISHHLGLDVHDVGPLWEPVQVGMVFTVEPGLYIPEEGFGVRLENDVLIGEDENIDLMAHIPIEPDEIEALMASR